MTTRVSRKGQSLDQDQISRNVAHAVSKMIEDGAALRETLQIINSVALKPKNLWIIEYHGYWHVRCMPPSGTKALFSHVSLATCVEFALKYEVPHD